MNEIDYIYNDTTLSACRKRKIIEPSLTAFTGFPCALVYMYVLATHRVMRFFKDYLDNEFSDKSTLLKRVKEEGFEMDHDPIGDGMCFYASAGHQLGLSAMTVQNILFDYLRNQRYDVRIYQPNL